MRSPHSDEPPHPPDEDDATECDSDLGLGSSSAGPRPCLDIRTGFSRASSFHSVISNTPGTSDPGASDPGIGGRPGSGIGQGTSTPECRQSIGSSLEKQKKICRRDVENVFIQKMIDEIQSESSPFSAQVFQYISQDHPVNETDLQQLKKRFFDAVDEVDRLKTDLSVRCRQLESKHCAIQILQSQLDQAFRAHQIEYEAGKNLDHSCKQLEKELEEVRWESEVRDYQVEQSQESWASKLERVQRENSQLHLALKRTQTQLKAVKRENAIINQEKQELLCLVQLSQNNDSSQGTSSLAEADTYHLTPSEMSALGACNCSVASTHPCRCAWTLVNSRREVKHLKSRVKELKKSEEQSGKVIDLYRSAFEGQLEKNKHILVSLVCNTVKSKPPTASSSNPTLATLETGELTHEKLTEMQSSREALLNLIDTLRDRTEELFHKRLSAKMLAERINELELQLVQSRTSSPDNAAPSTDRSASLPEPARCTGCSHSSCTPAPPSDRGSSLLGPAPPSDSGSALLGPAPSLPEADACHVHQD